MKLGYIANRSCFSSGDRTLHSCTQA